MAESHSYRAWWIRHRLKAGGFVLRLKAGSIGHSADFRHTTLKHLSSILRNLSTGTNNPNRRFEFIRTIKPRSAIVRMNSHLRIALRLAPSGLAFNHPAPKGEGFTDLLSGTQTDLTRAQASLVTARVSRLRKVWMSPSRTSQTFRK
jgi:hypothetical protein